MPGEGRLSAGADAGSGGFGVAHHSWGMGSAVSSKGDGGGAPEQTRPPFHHLGGGGICGAPIQGFAAACPTPYALAEGAGNREAAQNTPEQEDRSSERHHKGAGQPFDRDGVLSPSEDETPRIDLNGTRNEVINVPVRKCDHCNEIVLMVGSCSACNTGYVHKNTVENPETGFIHFIYECSGCPPARRKAQKIIKINDGNNGNGRQSSDDLIRNFL